MKIAFRIDISNEIGTGHYMRMSALADAFAGLGHRCEFFKGEDEPVDYSGFNIIIVDTYEVNDNYIAGLNAPNRSLVCYDDNALYTYNCDILLNANLYAGVLKFKLAGKSPHMLLGGKYALLRREFQENAPITINEHANNVFVCFGGSDLRNMTPLVVDALQGINGVRLSVVLGGYTKCDEQVFAVAGENTIIYKTPESMREVMRSCDIAVASSGTMTYELAALGLPSITISQAENQFLIAEYMSRNGLMSCVGNWMDVDFDHLRDEVEVLLADYGRRKTESAGLMKAVDKNGAYNAAREIIELHQIRIGG